MRIISVSLMVFAASVLAFTQAKLPATRVTIVRGVSISIPEPWYLANQTTNGAELAYPRSGPPPVPLPNEQVESAEELIAADARIAIFVEPMRNHADAVRRLVDIASEQAVHTELLTIADWPAIHQRYTGPLPQPGENASRRHRELALFTMTAIAAEGIVVRFDTIVAPKANPILANEAFQITKRVHIEGGNTEAARRDIDALSRLIDVHPIDSQKKNAPELDDMESDSGDTVVQHGNGELEVAISDDGLHVVVVANSGYAYSDDTGQDFTYGGKTPCIFNGCDGDPSIAIGKSGAVYYSWIGKPTAEPGGTPPNGKTDSLSISTNNGHSFKFLSNAVVCPTVTPKVCTTPDQEHIAADRKNSSMTGKDRVYLVWRNFSSLSLTPRIVCSSDGGKTWSAQTTIGVGDYPRVTVGGDGFVYVAYYSGSNIEINKFSPCDSGLVPQSGIRKKVAAYTQVVCPMPGLDRCDNGNTLSSQMVAVDDTNPSHIYVAFANNTSANNDDVMVYDSNDGGNSWNVPVRVNKKVTGRRFMPWVCTSGGIASVTWYDRRAATAAEDDLTAYYRAGAKQVSPPGVLQANPEVNVSGVNDPQCASGWPKGERSPLDATSCSTPQVAGKCQLPCVATVPPSCSGGFTGSNTPCIFNTPGACIAPETCQVWGRGAPKYGDYNGNACTPGLNGTEVPIICSVWASATPPRGVDTSATGIQLYASCNHYLPPGWCMQRLRRSVRVGGSWLEVRLRGLWNRKHRQLAGNRSFCFRPFTPVRTEESARFLRSQPGVLQGHPGAVCCSAHHGGDWR